MVSTCSRSTLKEIGRANLTTPERCALFALQKRGLAFNFSPPGLTNPKDACIVCDCPEFEAMTSLRKDWRYNYYSLYGNPLPSSNHSCVPRVGVFSLHDERLNFSQAVNACRASYSELAHVASEARTTALSSLVSERDHKMAYIGLENRKTEGQFVTTKGEPLRCFEYIAWAPSQPRNSLPKEDCVALDNNKLWRVMKCSIQLPFLCELWPGGDQPIGTATRLTECAAMEEKREKCADETIPEYYFNKFHRCWRGIKPKISEYKKKLPFLLEWNTRSKNETGQKSPPQNRNQNGTEKANPQNKTIDTLIPQNGTQTIPTHNGTQVTILTQNNTQVTVGLATKNDTSVAKNGISSTQNESQKKNYKVRE
ncbi:uncharacterized protein [Periplaneta americana]|uniref:uncharacterized protein n=1 Tax=Periplaneta americana TaxID=6978 RepID=UPI0037E709A9